MFDKSYSGDVAIAASQSVKEREYWLKKLSGEPVKSSFPYDNKEPGYKVGDNDHVDLRFSGELFSRLTWISNQSDARLLTVLAASLILLVNKYTGSRDVIVGMPIYKQEVEGDFINTVVSLRCLLQEDMTFKDLLYQVKQTIDEAVKHQNYPIKTLLYDLQLPFSESDFPLFDIVLLLKNIQDPGYVHIPVNIEFVFLRTPGYLEVAVQYNRSLYDRETVERIAGHFSHLLQAAIFDVDISLAGIDILPGEEKKKLLEEFNLTQTGFQDHITKTIHRLFEDQVEKTPDQAAVVFVRQGQDPETLTYRQLDAKAWRLARVLREKGISAGHIVALLIESSVHMAAAVLAVLKAGGAYLPIDMEAPEERKTFILKDSGVRLLLTGVVVDTAFSPAVGDIEQLDISDERLYTYDTQPQPYDYEMETGSAGDPAYIIYTSGSTGRPKGVIVEHCQAVNTLVCRKEEYLMTTGHTALQLFSYAFDGFITSFFTPIISGARVILLSKDTIQDIAKIVDVIVSLKVTHFISVPILFQALITGMTTEGAASLQVVTLAGDKVQSRLLEMAAAKNKNIEVVNEYGITEAAVMSTIYRRQERDRRVKIGHPICNTSIYITKGDDHQHLAPIGVFGEMCIAGAGVVRGYMNNPELTSMKFVGDNFRARVRMLRTGDLARWLPDGNIEFDGRMDFQVKVRGFRIELGEIERQLLAHSDIKDTIVTASESDEGDKYLCAYIVSTRQLSVSELREYLTGCVPEYMIPAYFVFLEGLPLSPNGKVDRKQLPPPTMSMTAGEYTAPRNRMEGQLVEIWAEILGIEKDSISIDANFFELGGHSLKATILLNRIIKEFNVRIAMVEIFKSPDIRSIVKLIKDAIEDIFVSINPAEEKEYYPLSPGQRRLFILNQMDFKSLAYNVSMTSVLGGKLDADKLERSFRQLIARHESLRTSFTTIGEHPVQKVHRDADLDFKIEYFTGDSLEHFEIANIVNNFVRPFDLSHAPLLRVGLVTMRTHEHILVVDMHHIVTDGVSHKILIENFLSLYQEQPLPPLRLQYKDYSEWQQGHRVKDVLQKQEEFWMQHLAGEVPKLDLPTDFQRPAIQSFAGDVLGFQLDREKTTALREIAASQSATLFTVLFAAYNIFLSKISNQEDIVAGTPVAGRRHSDLEQIIGVFINMLALRNAPRGETTFSAFLKNLTQRTIEAFDNQDYAFEDLVEEIVKDRDVSRNPLFDVVFSLQNMFDPSGTVKEHETGGLGVKPYSNQERKSAQFDLTLYAIEIGDTINFVFEYCTSLFKEDTIARFIQYFNKVIASVIEYPGKTIAEIEIITEEERNRILYEFNATEADYPKDKTIHRLFEEQVERTSDQVAIVGPTIGDEDSQFEHQLTYRQLDKKSNCLASSLREKGVEPDTIVGIMVERSVEMIVGIIGILKSGGAYLPIDPDYPQERINYMLKDSGAKVLINKSEIRNPKSETNPNVQIVNDQNKSFEDMMVLNFENLNFEFVSNFVLRASNLNPSNLAYIIYTSGTTGKSKAVIIEHQDVVRLMVNDKFLFDFNCNDIWTMFHSFCFDFSVWEMYGALLYGSRLVLIPKMAARDTHWYLKILKEKQVTILNQTPSAFYHLMELESKDPRRELNIRYVIFGGEALTPARLKEWETKYPDTKLINMYGITETTVHVTFKEIAGKEIESNISNIGKAIPTLTTYIMDKNLNVLPIGVPGELCIGGKGVGRGYLNRPGLTGEKFVKNLYNPRERLYRSGDLVKLSDKGELEYLGRIDQQVKVRGFRIELGEIESRLLNHPLIKETVVLACEEESGIKYLCAYIISDTELGISALREYLTKDLPDYMIPSYFIRLEKLPLTPNNKVDRKALPDPTIKAGENYIAPRDKLEEALAELWSEGLNIEKSVIGIDSNFFELGGHSLKATILITKILKEFQVKFPLPEVFKTPNIRGMAEYIKSAVKEKNISLEAQEKKEYYPVSSQQKRLFILQQRYLNLTAYNRPDVFISQVELDKEKLEATFRKLIQRHESLRTSFDMINGETVQKIHNHASFAIEYYDGDLIQETIENFVRPFDLSQAPLFRIRIIKSGDGKNILLVDIHHIISDGVSDIILIGDFMALFEGKQLPALKFQYKDFSQWQARLLESGEMKKQEKYWLETFSGEIPKLAIPRDYADSLERSFEGSGIYVELDDKKTGLLKELAKQEGTTLFMILFAIYNVLLAKLSGQEDIVVGTGVAGRRHVDFENIIGMFVNTLALRNYPSGEKTFKDFLHEIRERTLQAFENQDYLFEDLVEKVVTKNDPGRNPIFDTVFVMQNMESETVNTGNAAQTELLLKRQGFDAKISIFDITVFCEEIGGKLGIKVSYSTSVFQEETIKKYFDYYRDILSFVIDQNGLTFKLKDIRLASGLKVIESKLIKNETGDFGF